MATRKTPAQFQAEFRRLEQRRRQAVNNYNSAVRRHNSQVSTNRRKVQQAVNAYNADVRRYNAAVRANRARLQRELSAMSRPATVQRSVTYRTSVTRVIRTFDLLDDAVAQGTVCLADGVLELSENEAANSAAAFNALGVEAAPSYDPSVVESLRQSTISGLLRDVSSDLESRWVGALFALHPSNPDASRHFCTSAREMLTAMLETLAPDGDVITHDPHCLRTPNGSVSRRARVHFCLAVNGHDTTRLADFVEDDLDNVIALFDEFNAGTHGSAGRYAFGQLEVIKRRVEDAVRFLHRLAATTLGSRS